MFKQARHRLSHSHKQPSIEVVDPPNGFSDFHVMEAADKVDGQTPE